MPGPDSVTTGLTQPPQYPPPTTIGVIAENVVNGTTLDQWEVKEVIDLDEDETSPGVFVVQESYVSEWRPANVTTIDDHLLSTSAIEFSAMSQSGTEYRCVFTQLFRTRQNGTTGEGTRVESSGFTITHTITWRNGQWEYFSLKEGAQVLATAPGSGQARNPETGWARVPV
jgi:hypothetical protein